MLWGMQRPRGGWAKGGIVCVVGHAERTLFLQRTVWETYGIVAYCSLCIVDLNTEAHLTGIEVVVPYLGFSDKQCEGWFVLVTKYSIANTVSKPKPACAQTKTSPNSVATVLIEGGTPPPRNHSRPRGYLEYCELSRLRQLILV